MTLDTIPTLVPTLRSYIQYGTLSLAHHIHIGRLGIYIIHCATACLIGFSNLCLLEDSTIERGPFMCLDTFKINIISAKIFPTTTCTVGNILHAICKDASCKFSYATRLTDV
jgi:hypothetical protein